MNEIYCEWFALCMNTTTEGTVHPVLGVTPICTRCAARFDITPTHDLEPIPGTSRTQLKLVR